MKQTITCIQTVAFGDDLWVNTNDGRSYLCGKGTKQFFSIPDEVDVITVHLSTERPTDDDNYYLLSPSPDRYGHIRVDYGYDYHEYEDVDSYYAMHEAIDIMHDDNGGDPIYGWITYEV